MGERDRERETQGVGIEMGLHVEVLLLQLQLQQGPQGVSECLLAPSQRRQTQSYLHKCIWHLGSWAEGGGGVSGGYQLVAAAYQLIRCECDFNCCRCDAAFAKLESVIEIYGRCGNCTAKTL